jgi:chemotaxis protein CheD
MRVLHHDLGGTAYRKLSWTVGPDAPAVSANPI